MTDNLFFDCHLHVFTVDQIPMAAQVRGNARHVADLLDGLGIDNAAAFIRDGSKASGQQVFTALLGCYLRAHAGSDLTHVLVPLMVDLGLEYEGDHLLFEWQLEDLLRLKDSYPDTVLPFFAYDPNRAALRRDVVAGGVTLSCGTSTRSIVEQHVGPGKPFHGVKLYPSFGYYPDDSRLDWLYQRCQAQGTPITAHCGDDGGLAPKMVALLNLELDDVARIERHWQWANAPEYWLRVLRSYPGLRLNLAHLGGDGDLRDYARALRAGDSAALKRTWVAQILALLKSTTYPHVYADVSGCIYERSYPGLLRALVRDHPAIARKLLYGSDYYMSSMHAAGAVLQDRLQRLFWYRPGGASFFDQALSRAMTRDNPKRFLGLA